jgi:peroxiredoxin
MPDKPAKPTTDDARKIVVGETAPDFSLLDTTGTRRRLSELTKDSSCVVLFYRGHW